MAKQNLKSFLQSKAMQSRCFGKSEVCKASKPASIHVAWAVGAAYLDQAYQAFQSASKILRKWKKRNTLNLKDIHFNFMIDIISIPERVLACLGRSQGRALSKSLFDKGCFWT